jgi:hypothetical protein
MRSTGPASSHSHQRRGQVAAGRHQHVHYVMLRVTVSTGVSIRANLDEEFSNDAMAVTVTDAR